MASKEESSNPNSGHDDLSSSSNIVATPCLRI